MVNKSDKPNERTGPKRTPTAETGLGEEIQRQLAKSANSDTAEMEIPEEFRRTDDFIPVRAKSTLQKSNGSYASSTIRVATAPSSENSAEFNVIDSNTIFGAKEIEVDQTEYLQTTDELYIECAGSVPDPDCYKLILQAVRHARKNGRTKILITEQIDPEIDMRRLINCFKNVIEYLQAPSGSSHAANSQIDLQFFAGREKQQVRIVIQPASIKEERCTP